MKQEQLVMLAHKAQIAIQRELWQRGLREVKFNNLPPHIRLSLALIFAVKEKGTGIKQEWYEEVLDGETEETAESVAV